MPIIGNNTIIALTIDGRLDGQQLLLTHHYRLNVVTGPGFDMADVLDQLNEYLASSDRLYDRYVNVLSQQVTGMFAVLQVIHPIRYVRKTYNNPQATGEVTQVSLPPNVATAITLQCERAGKKFRGTKHIGGVPVTFTTNGLVNATGLALYNPLGTELLNEPDLDVIGFDGALLPVVYNRTSPATSPQVVTRIVQPTQRVERRRTVGLGS